MNGKLTKILPLAGLFCGSFFCTAAHAGSQDDATDSTMTSTTKEITPPAGFAADPGIGFSLYADFIYWEARQPNLGFASTGLPSATATSLVPGEVYYPSFNYKPGFKVGLGFDVGHDNWDIDANYTWLNGSAGKNSVAQEYGSSTMDNLFPVYTDLTSEELVAADGDWFLHYNLINANLGRNYFISQFLTLRPYFGLSGAWNNQKEVVHYTFANSSSLSGIFTSLNMKQNYWGVGFNTGLQTAWMIDENWSIYGNLGFMNLWSKYRVQKKETNYLLTDNVIDPTSEAIAYYTQDTDYGFQNVVDLELGVRYGLRFDDNNMGFAMQLGWEQQIWINHAQYSGSNSNLSLQGLTARVRFDF